MSARLSAAAAACICMGARLSAAAAACVCLGARLSAAAAACIYAWALDQLMMRGHMATTMTRYKYTRRLFRVK